MSPLSHCALRTVGWLRQLRPHRSSQHVRLAYLRARVTVPALGPSCCRVEKCWWSVTSQPAPRSCSLGPAKFAAVSPMLPTAQMDSLAAAMQRPTQCSTDQQISTAVDRGSGSTTPIEGAATRKRSQVLFPHVRREGPPWHQRPWWHSPVGWGAQRRRQQRRLQFTAANGQSRAGRHSQHIPKDRNRGRGAHTAHVSRRCQGSDSLWAAWIHGQADGRARVPRLEGDSSAMRSKRQGAFECIWQLRPAGGPRLAHRTSAMCCSAA